VPIEMSQPMRLLTSHVTEEWYTPPSFVELARLVMGGIDLDPASNATAQAWVQAARYYDERANGLNFDWHGRVWLNPPYGKTNGKSNQEVWSKRLEYEYTRGHVQAGVLLVNSTHGYKWYEQLWLRWPVCLVRDRIRFIKPDGTQGGQAKRGQTFVYFGSNVQAFERVFSAVGRVVHP
jgi:hypothetical protein